jgi:hypothetical protein
MTSANETQPPLQSSPADEINHHTVIGVVDPGESAVLLAARVVAPAIRSRLVERATPVETISARLPRELMLLSVLWRPERVGANGASRR